MPQKKGRPAAAARPAPETRRSAGFRIARFFPVFNPDLDGNNVAQAYAAMTLHPIVLAATLFAIAPVAALENEAAAQTTETVQPVDEGDKPAPTVRTADGGHQAVPREAHPRVEARPAPAPAPAVVAVRAEQPQPQPVAVAADDQRRTDGSRDRGGNPQTGGAAQRGGDRPRGDNPPTGQAAPRGSRPAPAPVGPQARREGNGGRNIYAAPPVYNYYYSPRRYYPYGYGAFGLGYFYYDPYTWYPPSYYGGGYGGGYYGGGYDNGYYYDTGEVRMAVSPRSAEVYVDGYYAGRVDDFDGVFQALKLESGAHHIQIVAPGYQPLDFDVRLNPGQKITYRGDLRR
jgi:PEGA domain